MVRNTNGNGEGNSEVYPFSVTVLTLFPEYFDGPLKTSLLGKAIQSGRIAVDLIDPRDHAHDKHRTVDDVPYGGGPGMVLKPEPFVEAIEEARSTNPNVPVMLLSPHGRRFDHDKAVKLAQGRGLIVVCGRYEGFDERIRSFVDVETSIGDFVVSGGEVAAVVVIDAVSRFLSGVLGNTESTHNESFVEGSLEYPQYTRPVEFRGVRVPSILVSGNHAKIRRWRRAQALERTRVRRPDLFEQLVLSEMDEQSLVESSNGPNDDVEAENGYETDH